MKRYNSLYLGTVVLVVGLTAVFLALIFGSGSSQAAGPWHVAPGGDDGNDCISPGFPCATINGALGKPTFVSGDTILVASGVYTGTGDEVVYFRDTAAELSGGWELDFSKQTGRSTIDGEGERVGLNLDGSDQVTVKRFLVQNCKGSGINVGYSSLVLSDSIVHGNNGDYGGGIENYGDLTLKRCSVSNNKAEFDGGGIYNAGILALTNSTINDNKAWNNGGGIATNPLDGTILTNSTISGNFAKDFGGGVFVSAVPPKSNRWMNIHNCTISFNSAVEGGGIYQEAGEPYPFLRTTQLDEMMNSILSGNFDKEESSLYRGEFISDDYNLDNTDAMLLPLEGWPGYHPLHYLSPAIDAGDPTGCKDYNYKNLETDQRGVERNGRCDIGAYEYDSIRYLVFPLMPRSE